MTSHSLSILGSCHLIHGQLERGEDLSDDDREHLAIAREYIDAFLSGQAPVPADCYMGAMKQEHAA